MLSFLDIQSLDDFWDWLPNHFAPLWYANQRGDSLHKFKVADGFRYVARESIHRQLNLEMRVILSQPIL